MEDYKIVGRYLTAFYVGKNGKFSSTVAYANGSNPEKLARMAYASAKHDHDNAGKRD